MLNLLLLFAAVVVKTHGQKSSKPNFSSSSNQKPLQFSSPLQTYTLFDKSSKSDSSPRMKFLPRIRVGLLAERRAHELILDEQRRGEAITGGDDDDDYDSEGWAERSAEAEERKKKLVERRLEQAYDDAVGKYDSLMASRAATALGKSDDKGGNSKSQYQFVGVVHSGTGAAKKEVTWYARKKPKKSKWSVRLVHVNRDAVLRDLFIKGKIDVFGKYANQGLQASNELKQMDQTQQEGEGSEEKGMKPLIMGKYSVKERSWRTLWNFHPKRFFTTSSGAFWRERRISPGLFTDGITVYESTYRYRDGKNGMKPVTKLSSFLSNPNLNAEEKIRVVERLKGDDGPDLVVEK